MTERWTVLKILRWTAEYFESKGLPSGRLDAELLLADILELDRVGLYVQFERPLTPEELATYRSQIQRRAAHEPVQYILGETEFWSLPLQVSPDVLIPRADTEVLVEEALLRIEGPASLLDVGTGSGAVALALAKEKPGLQVTALDCSAAALAVAQDNAARNGLAERVTFLQGDLADLPDRRYDLVVSNPPYIAASEWETLMPEVREHEPRLALFGGQDGLDAYRHLARQSRQILEPGGWLLVEIGATQAEDVKALFSAAGLCACGIRNDYAGLPRVVFGQAESIME